MSFPPMINNSYLWVVVSPNMYDVDVPLKCRELSIMVILCLHCNCQHPSSCFFSYVFLELPYDVTELGGDSNNDAVLSDREAAEDVSFVAMGFDDSVVDLDTNLVSSEDSVEVPNTSKLCHESPQDFISRYEQPRGK